MALWEETNGGIGALPIDITFPDERVDLPIDTHIFDFTREDGFGEGIGKITDIFIVVTF